MDRNISNGEKIFGIFNCVFMLVMIIICGYPLLYVLFASFSRAGEFVAHQGLLLWPKGFSLDAYKAVSKNPNILNGFKNTFFVVTVGVTINMIMTLLGAYFLSRKGVMLKRIITLFIVFTMYFHGGIIPFYLIVRDIGLENKLWALIIPVSINTFNLIVMRTALAAVPDSMEESARMDGASHITILFRIMVPLVRPTIAVLVLYYAVFHWNSWFHSLIFIRNRKLYPLQLVLREIILQNRTEDLLDASLDTRSFLSETVKYAVIMVANLPILMLYPIIQKHFVKGVMIGALKE